MASNWAKYLEERQEATVLEKPHGFAVYKFMDKYCYITEIYVAPEARGSDLLPQMMQEITFVALSKGYDKLLGSVDLKDKRAAQNMAIHLHYGFQPLYNDAQLTYFQLSISSETTFSKRKL